MRKINTRQFNRGTRSTPREINRKIVLNLVREHQPIRAPTSRGRWRWGGG
jgi:N-acetylglucosamine repressor